MRQAAECIAKGQEKYNAGDRMGALKFFEQSLQKVWWVTIGQCTLTPFTCTLFIAMSP
jgi:hypothetical protein